MRYEILKFLSDSHDFKPLNEFIESIYPYGDNYEPLNVTLREMFNPHLSIEHGENLIYLDGEYDFLGKEFYFKIISDDQVRMEFKELYYPNPLKPKPDLIFLGTLGNSPFRGRISALGRKELAEYELQKSIKETNESVKSTNKITIVIAVLATVFSLTSVVIAITKTERMQVEQLQETNSILQKQTKTLDSLLQKVNLSR